MISCILLSAGLNRRFGSPKALAHWETRTVIECTLDKLRQTKLFQIIVVLGAYRDEIAPFVLHKDGKTEIVYNQDYRLGQTSSFKAGLQSVSAQSKGIMLFPVDYPRIDQETVDGLIESFMAEEPKIMIPVFEQKKGHPPIFHISLQKEIARMDNDLGLNTIAHRYKEQTILINVPDRGILETFNTKEELACIKNDKDSFK